jgi:hypothetical protein
MSNATMLCVNHGTKLPDTIHVSELKQTMPTVDMSSLTGPLQEIVKVIKEASEKPPCELRVPLPEFHNNVEVKPTPIEVQAPTVENRIEVNPTPFEILVPTPSVENHVRCDPVINFDISSLVRALYILSGVLGVSMASAITAAFILSP